MLKQEIPSMDVCLPNAYGFQPIIKTRVCHVRRLLLTPSSYLSSFFETFDCNFNNLELGLFKVVQVKGNGAYQKPIGGFLCDIHCMSHGIRDI